LLPDSKKPEFVDENTSQDKGKRWFHNIKVIINHFFILEPKIQKINENTIADVKIVL